MQASSSTPSGAVTVLEHSLESYRNILKQAPSNVRAPYSALRGWLREYAETLRRYDGTSGSSSHQTQSAGLVPMDVDQTRAVKGFSSGKDRRGKSNGKGKSKDGRGKGKGKKGDKSKDQKPLSKPQQFQGYCGYCDKWRHKRADCRKRIADAKSKGGAAAASADDGDVAAVMEVDDVVMRAGDDETSTGWCFALTSMCVVVGLTGSLLLDSGSDDHLITTSPDRSPSSSKMCNRMIWRSQVKRPCPCWWDRQVASIPRRQRPHSEFLRYVTTSCRWENWFERVSASIWVLVVARWKRTAGKCRSAWNATVCVWRLMFWSVHRDLDTWWREQLSRTSAWMVWTSKSPTHRRVLGQL